jgi:hypothetical protein
MVPAVPGHSRLTPDFLTLSRSQGRLSGFVSILTVPLEAHAATALSGTQFL